MEKPLALLVVLELFRLIRDIWKLGEVVLRAWKPRLSCVVKLWGAFMDMWKLRGGFIGVWKLGLLAHTKLSVCNRGLRETSGLLCVCWNFGRVRWWFCVVGWSSVVVRWLWSVVIFLSSVSFFSSVSAFRGKLGLLSYYWNLDLRFVYIFRSVGRGLSAMQHRAVGGASDGGVKGIPLNNPLVG